MKQYVLNITKVCFYSSPTYPACKHQIFCKVLYYHLWPVCLYHIFPNYLTNSTIYGKPFSIAKYVLGFFYDCWLRYFSYWEEFSEILSYISTGLSVKYNYTRLTKFEVSLQIFEKTSNTKFHENLSSRSRVVPCGQTDGHDETSIVAFCNFGTPQKF